jgi:hypothetical protein
VRRDSAQAARSSVKQQDPEQRRGVPGSSARNFVAPTGLALRQRMETSMPIILWLLGVPLSLILVLWLVGVV